MHKVGQRTHIALFQSAVFTALVLERYFSRARCMAEIRVKLGYDTLYHQLSEIKNREIRSSDTLRIKS